MDIIYISTDALIPYERNPRKIEQAIDAVAKSIEDFGFKAPIVVDKDRVVIMGHVRLAAAKRLGLNEVPVHVAHDLNETQVKQLRLADNRLGELAEWDEALLARELDQLDEEGADLLGLGFTADELSRLLMSLSMEPVFEVPPDLDEAPTPPIEPKTKLGDLYTLGSHRLLCGDATSLASYKRLLGDDLADMVFTDPPYNVAYEGSTSDKLTIQNDDMDEDSFFRFLGAFFVACRQFTKKGGAIYVCHADGSGDAFRKAFRLAKWTFAQCLVWVKSQFSIGRSDYQYQHEPILYGWRSGAAHNWHGGRDQSTVWNFNKPKRNDKHPTMKPVALVQKAIENSSQEGDLVLDPFGGSGTTMVASQSLGRISALIELDPTYCDVIVERMRSLYPDIGISVVHG